MPVPSRVPRRPRRRTLVAAVALFGAVGAAAVPAAAGASASPGSVTASADDDTVVLVHPEAEGSPVSSMLTGVNNDKWFDGAHGLWNAEADAPEPRVVASTARAGINLVRYPGGTPATFFDWKKAIGPTEQRGCQTDGRPGRAAPRDSVYGPDEHMEFVTAAGAEASLMMPFVKNDPASAADWVEYMNAPVGSNPRGGVAWADVRAANGHPEPWGVTRWEVGNEHDRVDQRYWMSADAATAMRQYAYGGGQPQVGQRLGRGCDFRSNVTADGTPGQQMSVAYAPVAPDSQTVRVDGVAWQEVGDLAGSPAGAKVYTIDDATGEVRFGDGVQGAVPGKGAVVDADYVSGPHAGFVDLQRAMKEADPDIDVCATWAPITEDTGLGGESLPDLLASRGDTDALDCLVVHPYTNFGRQFGTTVDAARTLHDWHMLGEAAATQTLQHYTDELRAAVGSSGYLTTTEFGALFFGVGDLAAYPSWNTAMSHATYMASQWARLADLGVPWAEGNTLISENSGGLRAVLGGAPGFIETSEHVVRTALRPFVEGGGSVVGHEVRENPVVTTAPTSVGSSYPALVTTASRGADGRVRVVVVNRDPERDLPARLVAAGFPQSGVVDVVRVTGSNADPGRESFESHNAPSHPHEVTTSRETVRTTGAGSVPLTFPKHSVTIVTLSPR